MKRIGEIVLVLADGPTHVKAPMLLGMQFLRRCLALAIVVTALSYLLPTVGSTFAQEAPYGAKVATRSATVRSGPGAEFYATDRLPFETRLEVYRHDGEWAAVRPPRGSFSWVPASAIELTEETTTGYVVGSGIRTRIGSRFGDDHTAEYVELNPDEEVTILARRTIDEDGVPTRWYQIEPPPGEFRWVQLSSIEPIQSQFAAPTAPSSAIPKNDDQDDRKTAKRDSILLTSDVDSSALPPNGPVQIAQHIDVPDPLEPIPDDSLTGESDDTFTNSDESADVGLGFNTESLMESEGDDGAPNLDIPQSTPARTQNAQPGWSAPPSANDKPPFRSIGSSIRLPTTPTATKDIDQNVLRQELAKITLELTRQVVQPPNVWELVEFRARAQAVIDLSSSTKLRSESQALLSRIAQFEDIQRRSSDLTSTFSNNFLEQSDLSASSASALQSLRTDRPPSSPSPSPSKSKEDPYDGSGWLMPVVTRQAGVPRYALTDDHGNILQFVSPRPGLNLRNYEKRRIAIMGSKGFIPRYNKPHLTAERIISLDRVRF